MKNLLNDSYISIQFLDSDALELISEVTEIDFLVILYERRIGNNYIGQAEDGSYYTFCETQQSPALEITLNQFLKLAQ